MKNSKILSLVCLLFIGIASMTSCSKYEGGPGISLRSKTARVVNHWKVSKVLLDGEDITEFFENQTYEFKKDNTYTVYDDGTASENGKWAFVDSKNNLELIDNEYPEDKISYKIMKLKDKEMMWEIRTEDDELVEYIFLPK